MIYSDSTQLHPLCNLCINQGKIQLKRHVKNKMKITDWGSYKNTYAASALNAVCQYIHCAQTNDLFHRLLGWQSPSRPPQFWLQHIMGQMRLWLKSDSIAYSANQSVTQTLEIMQCAQEEKKKIKMQILFTLFFPSQTALAALARHRVLVSVFDMNELSLKDRK